MRREGKRRGAGKRREVEDSITEVTRGIRWHHKIIIII